MKINSSTVTNKTESVVKPLKSIVSLNDQTREALNRYDCHFVQFKNGLRLCLVSLPAINTVSLRSFILVGSIYEHPEISGISHFLEHMLFRGNSKLGDATLLSRKMEEMGGEFNAATSFDMTEYWLDIHKDFLESGITRFCQFHQYPLMEQIDVERAIILEEVLVDYNEENNLIDLDSLTSELLWPNHPMGMPIIGNKETIHRMTQQDLFDWHKQFYKPQNIILGITGDFDPAKVIDLVDSEFPQEAPIYPSVQYQPIEVQAEEREYLRLVKDKDNQFSFQWSFPCYQLSKERKVEYELIRRILDDGNSSRLQRLIREEKGLVYDISADMTYFSNGSVLTIQSMVGTGRLEELMTALIELIEGLIKKGVTKEEFSLAKSRYKSALECSIDSAQGVLYNHLAPVLYPSGSTSTELLDNLSKVTIDSINSLLKGILKQNKTAFALVGPWEEETEEMLKEKLAYWISGRNISK